MRSQSQIISEYRAEIYAYLELGGVLCAAVWWYLDARAGFWPVLICLGLWGLGILGRCVHWWDYRVSSPLDAPMLAFITTAGAALWATYAAATKLNGFPIPIGQDKFWLITGSILIFYALARLPSLRSIQVTTALIGLLSVAISIYFLVSNDFSSQPEKFHFIHQLGLLVQKVQPHWRLQAPPPNWAGGLSAMFLPGILETMRYGRQVSSKTKRAVLFAACGAAICISGLGILLSSSRGAWIALFVGLSAWFGVWLIDRLAARSGIDKNVWERSLAIILVLGGALALLGIFLFRARILSFFPALVENASYFPRQDLQNSAVLLIRDYPFTGSGLGTFPLVFSIYTLLINVPAIIDAHNLLLDLAVSQGIPGLLVWLVILGGTVSLAWQARINNSAKYRLPLGGACVMLIVMLVHGLVEDPYYDSRAVLLWLVPAGLIAAQARLVETGGQAFIKKTRAITGIVIAGIGLFILAGALALPAWRAAFLANLGAAAQTRVELNAYDPAHFDHPTLDSVRRQADLSQAAAYFAQALSIDPHQNTALQRLAEIALSRQEYDQALAWMEQAAAVDPSNRITRLLLGDALVASGKPSEAAALADGLPFAKGRLSGEAWYRYHLDGDLTRENWADLADAQIK
jgi:O-antigen ligase